MVIGKGKESSDRTVMGPSREWPYMMTADCGHKVEIHPSAAVWSDKNPALVGALFVDVQYERGDITTTTMS